MFSWSDKPGGSRKKGWGRDRVCSGGETGHDAKELDDDDTARLATMCMMPETPELTCTGTTQTVSSVVGCGAKKT
jgi:hypothetical protein